MQVLPPDPPAPPLSTDKIPKDKKRLGNDPAAESGNLFSRFTLSRKTDKKQIDSASAEAKAKEEADRINK